ncbi:hypothetical protein [Levilactobacillus mulengensis]|uniref:hypothetical protein n=1 Tax=Levilactobacillus mulengensis TaxID=2486025 RepID=UPI000F77ECA0|nr:hypothetical protein [Levilactobacillus mulengensis]
MNTSSKLISFIKSQMDTAKFKYDITLSSDGNTLQGCAPGLPGEDEKVFPQHVNVDQYYSPNYSGIISGTWFNLATPDNYKVEVYLVTDDFYLQDTCDLSSNGRWSTSKAIGSGLKEIRLVQLNADKTTSFVEYPYSRFVNYTARFFSLTDAEYLNAEVPIFDVGNGQYIFYTNKVYPGLKIAKLLQRVWRAGAFEYDVVGLTGAETNIHNGRLPSSFLIPANDPSYDKDGTKALRKYGYMLNSRSWLYDIGLSLLTFTASGDYDLCQEILKRLSVEQNSDGSFDFSYDNYIGALFENYVRTGAVGWVVWGMTHYMLKTNDKAQLAMAEKAGDWLLTQMVTDPTDKRYGLLKGGNGAYGDNYAFTDTKIEWCSTEHQLSSMQGLYGLLKVTGNQKYQRALDKIHRNLINTLFDSDNQRFYQGVSSDGVDKSWALDCVTWAGMTVINDKVFSIDSTKLLKTAQSIFSVNDALVTERSEQDHFNETYSSTSPIAGFKPYSDRDGGYSGSPEIVWTEGTLGYIALCKKLGNTAEADKYLSGLEGLQNLANSTGGIIYATETYASLPWEFHTWESVVSSSWLYLTLNDVEAVFPQISFTNDLQENTIEAANADLEYYHDNLAFLKAIPKFQVSTTAATYTFESPAVDVTWRLEVGTSISVPSSDKIVVYTVKDGKVSNNLDGIKKLLTENKVFSFDGLDQILGKIAVKVKNGSIWIDTAGGSGFTLHIEREHTEVNKVQVAEDFEIAITIKFHKIVVTTPTEAISNYNTEVEPVTNFNWVAAGVVVLLVLGIVLVPGIGTLAEGTFSGLGVFCKFIATF